MTDQNIAATVKTPPATTTGSHHGGGDVTPTRSTATLSRIAKTASAVAGPRVMPRTLRLPTDTTEEPVKKQLWRLRVAFHDWMWQGGAQPDVTRRLARRLPVYFSDPFLVEWVGATWAERATWTTSTAPQTWTTSSATNFTVTWPLSPENPYR